MFVIYYTWASLGLSIFGILCASFLTVVEPHKAEQWLGKGIQIVVALIFAFPIYGRVLGWW